MKNFKQEVEEFENQIAVEKEAIMASQNLKTDADFKTWCKKVVQGSRTFKSLFSIEITIRFKDIAIINFTIPKK